MAFDCVCQLHDFNKALNRICIMSQLTYSIHYVTAKNDRLHLLNGGKTQIDVCELCWENNAILLSWVGGSSTIAALTQ